MRGRARFVRSGKHADRMGKRSRLWLRLTTRARRTWLAILVSAAVAAFLCAPAQAGGPPRSRNPWCSAGHGRYFILISRSNVLRRPGCARAQRSPGRSGRWLSAKSQGIPPTRTNRRDRDEWLRVTAHQPRRARKARLRRPEVAEAYEQARLRFELAEAVRTRREELGWSQRQLAERAAMTQRNRRNRLGIA